MFLTRDPLLRAWFVSCGELRLYGYKRLGWGEEFTHRISGVYPLHQSQVKVYYAKRGINTF